MVEHTADPPQKRQPAFLLRSQLLPRVEVLTSLCLPIFGLNGGAGLRNGKDAMVHNHRNVWEVCLSTVPFHVLYPLTIIHLQLVV